MPYFVAIDLGASSGRVAVGEVTDKHIKYEVIHRFINTPIHGPKDSLLWDWKRLNNEIRTGLEKVADAYKVESIAVDTWAVDYILYDANSAICAPTYSYRDDRTLEIMETTLDTCGKEALYETTGIQFLPFNTLYQLLAAKSNGELIEGRKFLMLPDAINFSLCGKFSNEITNASTTQLLDTAKKKWDWNLIKNLGFRGDIFPPLHEAGKALGTIQGIAKLENTKVVSVGSHDTASAVAGTPLTNPETDLYISSGTWSLIGCEIDFPIRSKIAMESNLTNELGIEGKVRLLKNVAGMWIVSSVLQELNEKGDPTTVAEFVEAAKTQSSFSTIDPNDPVFIPPGKMIERIQNYTRERSILVPETKAELARCVYDSLAKSYVTVIDLLEKVTNKKFVNIYVVGGGSANAFLNQLTADATGLTVIAGPVEATLLGNIGVQAITAGVIKNLTALRSLISKSFDLEIFTPQR
jgi:rhamnulokinase